MCIRDSYNAAWLWTGWFFQRTCQIFCTCSKTRTCSCKKKKAVKTGIQVLHDVSDGKSFKKAIKERGRQNINELASDIKNEIKQSTITRKRTSKKKGSLKNQKKKKTDIFD